MSPPCHLAVALALGLAGGCRIPIAEGGGVTLTVSGRVVEGGGPVAGAVVSIGQASSTTTVDGSYRLSVRATSPVSVRVSAEGFAPMLVVLDVAAGTTSLERDISLARIRTASFDPADRVDLEVARPDGEVVTFRVEGGTLDARGPLALQAAMYDWRDPYGSAVVADGVPDTMVLSAGQYWAQVVDAEGEPVDVPPGSIEVGFPMLAWAVQAEALVRSSGGDPGAIMQWQGWDLTPTGWTPTGRTPPPFSGDFAWGLDPRGLLNVGVYAYNGCITGVAVDAEGDVCAGKSLRLDAYPGPVPDPADPTEQCQSCYGLARGATTGAGGRFCASMPVGLDVWLHAVPPGPPPIAAVTMPRQVGSCGGPSCQDIGTIVLPVDCPEAPRRGGSPRCEDYCATWDQCELDGYPPYHVRCTPLDGEPPPGCVRSDAFDSLGVLCCDTPIGTGGC